MKLEFSRQISGKKIPNFIKIRKVGVVPCEQTDERTDERTQIEAFRIFAKANC
jgi:hypothetical protein